MEEAQQPQANYFGNLPVQFPPILRKRVDEDVNYRIRLH